MRIFCCYTAAHQALFRGFFYPSLAADFNLQATYLDAITGAGDFLSRDFLACIRRKIDLLLRSLERHEGEVIVWSDVDVVFFRPVAAELRGFLEREQLDIAFQGETKGITNEVNTGFFVCRASPRVADLFHRVHESLDRQPAWNEQMAVNDLLVQAGGGDLRWSLLGRAYYARTHGWPPPRDLALYHANETTGANGVARKIAQFEELRRIRRYGPLALAWSCMTKVPKRLSRFGRERLRLARPPAWEAIR